MTPPGRSSKRPSAMPARESGKMNPIFAHDELPNTFSKHLRAPVSGKFMAANRSTHASSMARSNVLASQNSSDSGPTDSDSNHSEFHASGNEDSTVAPSRASKSMPASGIKIPGGRAAIAKKVNGEQLDSDDEIIKTMRDQGYRDELIQERLVKEDRVKYNVKSIATRYGRICRALATVKTAKLDGEQTDWHDGDDDVLDDAIRENAYCYNRDLGLLNRKYWTAIAEESEKRMGKARFSRNACRERYEARQNDTAEPTLEADADQEGRMARRERWAAERQQRKDEAAAQQEAKEQARLTRVEAVRRKHEEKQLERAERLAEQEERRRIKRDQKQELKASKEAEIEARVAFKEAEEKKRVEKLEKKKQDKLKKRQNQERLKKRREAAKRLKQARAAKSLVEKQESQLAKAKKKLDNLEAEETISHNLSSSMGEDIDLSNEEDDGNISDVETPPRKKTRISPESKVDRAGATHVTSDKAALKSIALSCRQSIGIQKLRDIAHARELLTKGTKEDLLTRIADTDVSLRLAGLRALLQARGVSRTGKKVDLIRRLAMADAGKDVNRRRNPKGFVAKKRTNSEMKKSASNKHDDMGGVADDSEHPIKEDVEASDGSEADDESDSMSGESVKEDDSSEAEDESSEDEEDPELNEGAAGDDEDVEMGNEVPAGDLADDDAQDSMNGANGKEVEEAIPKPAKSVANAPSSMTAYGELEGTDDKQTPEEEDLGAKVDIGDQSV